VGKEALSESAVDQIQSISGSRPARFALEVMKAWAVIIGVIASAVYVDHWLATIAAILIVATRQNVLGLLVHEQTHMGFGRRLG
jgi:fatty acid desaturase